MSNEDFYMVYSNYNIESVIKILVFPKNSEEYKNELSVLLETKASQLDKKSQEILQKFNLTLNDECLTEKKIKSLPNLFSGSIESADYAKYLNVMMLDISNSQLLTPSILEYLISYLEKVNLDDDSCFKNHHMITILYMLLYFYFGENGCNFIKGHESRSEARYKTIIEIEKYISDFNSSLQEKLEPTFLKTCEFLKKLLHHKKYPILNFKARDICHHFGIKLDLSLMIRLCIDGVKQENEDIENLFMFIGNSGSGKSTTINYLYGIGYRLVCSKKTQKYYLKQVDENVIAPAKVGHGNVSETLYPKIIKKGNLSFCDFPGFNDTRDEAYKTCASLGLPIAVHYAKNKSIGAIVVVIDWETITLLRGDELLKTIKTIHSLMNDLGSSSLKLLYAITRPPTPPDDQYRERDDDESSDLDDDAEYCDSQSLVEKVLEHLKLNINKLTNEFNDLTLRTSNDSSQLLIKISDLTACMKVFEKLGVGSFESHGHTSGWKMTFLKLIDTSGVVKKGSNVIVKQNIMKELIKDKSISSSDLVNERIEKFIDQIFKELESKSDQKEKIIEDLIEKETQKLDNEMEDCQKEIEKIKKKLEDKNVLIEFLKNIKADDIYIIRGFKLNEKWKDHKEKLLERIQNICIKNDDQTSIVPLKIDGKSEQFSVVINWSKEESKRCGTMLNDVIDGIQKIEKLKKNIDELDNDIQVNEKSLRLALVSSRENENKIIENLKKTINSLNERKKNLEKELEKTTNNINEMNKEIRDIEESPAIEYGSKIIIKKRSKFMNFFSKSYAQYTFPKTYYEKTWSWTDWITGGKKHILPIDRVEFSYVVNKENKIVFKTPLKNNQIDTDRIEIVENIEEKPYFIHDKRIRIIQENEPNFKSSGTILFVTDKLDQGDFIIRVALHDDQDGFIGVRCFVKPIHFPENKQKIEDLKNKINEKEKEKLEIKKQLEGVMKEIKEKTEHYDCVVKGLYDQKKGGYILKFLIDLEYSPDDFVDILMKEIKEESGDKTDIEWLEKDENFKEIKKAFANYDEMKKHFDEMPKNLLQDFIFTKNEEFIKKEMEYLKKEKFEAVKFDFQRLLRLYKISSKSGLSFIVLREIVKSLKGQRGQVNNARYLKRALKEEIEKLRKGLKSFQEKSELFEKRKWVFDVLDIVVDVLSYHDLVEYTEFIKVKKSYDTKDFKTVLESANNRINKDQPLN